jgi:hypothetical protein
MCPCCHTGLVFQSSWLPHESVVSSSAADQLLILLTAWRAGPTPIPLPRVDPISLRVHASSRSLVSYTFIDYNGHTVINTTNTNIPEFCTQKKVKLI